MYFGRRGWWGWPTGQGARGGPGCVNPLEPLNLCLGQLPYNRGAVASPGFFRGGGALRPLKVYHATPT